MILVDNLMTTRFNKPIELKHTSAIAMSIIRLFLLDPGENQSHPDMGLGLVSKYRYSFKEELKNIEREMYRQIETYLPILQDVKITLTYDETVLYISLEVTGLIIKLDFSDDILRLRDIVPK